MPWAHWLRRIGSPVRTPALLSLAGLAMAAPALADLPAHPEPPVLSRPAPRGLTPQAWEDALAAHACAASQDPSVKPDVLVIVDFSRPSTEERLWVVRPDTGEVVLRTLVAHGQGTGGLMATTFSNVPESHASSLGVFRGAETYTGRHGPSLRLDGLEPGINDLARQRAIVVHAADYATADFAERVGRLGRSHGCPAVPPEDLDAVVDVLGDGGLLVAWADEDTWRSRSTWLTCPAPSEP